MFTYSENSQIINPIIGGILSHIQDKTLAPHGVTLFANDATIIPENLHYAGIREVNRKEQIIIAKLPHGRIFATSTFIDYITPNDEKPFAVLCADWLIDEQGNDIPTSKLPLAMRYGNDISIMWRDITDPDTFKLIADWIQNLPNLDPEPVTDHLQLAKDWYGLTSTTKRVKQLVHYLEHNSKILSIHRVGDSTFLQFQNLTMKTDDHGTLNLPNYAIQIQDGNHSFTFADNFLHPHRFRASNRPCVGTLNLLTLKHDKTQLIEAIILWLETFNDDSPANSDAFDYLV